MKNNGFSLAELLVVITMFSILATAGYKLYREQSRINQSQENLLEMQSSGRSALQILIQAFNHAGFGCSENISSAGIPGTNAFIIHTNGNFTGSTPDEVVLTNGYAVYGSVKLSSNGTKFDIDYNNNLSGYTTSMIQTEMGTNFGKYICLFPSMKPNTIYEINNVSGDEITLTEAAQTFNSTIEHTTKIYRVSPRRFYISNGQLLQREIIAAREDVIAFDVQDFQVAYTSNEADLSNPSSWNDELPAKPKAVWIYLLLHSKERELGFQESRTFELPWSTGLAGQQLDGSTLPAGFHYQEFQTQVWLRNAN